eukprot:11508066-Alexandrium_andersonii.AAC.1
MLRPSQAAKDPEVVVDPVDEHDRKPVLVRGQGHLVGSVGDVGAEEADLVCPELPAALHCIRDD